MCILFHRMGQAGCEALGFTALNRHCKQADINGANSALRYKFMARSVCVYLRPEIDNVLLLPICGSILQYLQRQNSHQRLSLSLEHF